VTTIENPGRAKVQAIFLRAHLRLLAAGMKNSQLSGTQILAKAGQITGNTYKRGQYEQALADLTTYIKENTQ
jgi:hypothetical protein